MYRLETVKHVQPFNYNIELHSWQELFGFDLKEKANRSFIEYSFEFFILTLLKANKYKLYIMLSMLYI